MSREQPSRRNFNFFTTIRGRDGRLKPDHGNRFYLYGSRGRGSGLYRPPHYRTSEPDIKEGLTKIFETIPTPARPIAPPEKFPINNVKYVASYNWADKEKPTIVVPGASRSFIFSLFFHV